ncbi:hypothetical protein ACFL52_01045 [Candidatus Margulisiibacteriota bacterium]
MIKNSLVTTILLILMVQAAFAFVPWLDTWNKAAYYTTNAEKTGFNAFLARSDIRAGVDLTDELPDIPSFSPYVVYLLTASQDQNYWNNISATGFGVRLLPFEAYEASNWSDEWIKDVKVFAEVLEASFFKDEATATTNQVLTSDQRIGFDLYHEWNQADPDLKAIWAEVWSNLSYRSSNFYQGGFKTYLLAHEQKTGIYLNDAGVKPYLRTNLNLSGRPEAWLNNLVVGPGIQLEPFSNFNLHLEVLSLIWYKEKDSRPSTDVRFGAEYRLYLK